MRYAFDPELQPILEFLPALAIDDLSGLPPAYISTMEFDPLRDEGVLYALKLMRAGVATELHCYPGTFHGSSLVASADVSRREAAEMFAVLRRGLGIAAANINPEAK